MIPARQIFRNILRAMLMENDQGMRDRVKDQFNEELWDVIPEVSWEPLREMESMDFTANTDETGLWVPGNLAGIDAVWDTDHEVRFWPRGRAGVAADDQGYRFYLYRPSSSHLASGDDVTLQDGAMSFTSSDLDTAVAAGADVTDAWVRFGAELGYYQITNTASPYLITPAYQGPDLAQENFRVRDWEVSKKMVLLDPSENKLADRTVELHYWRYPTPIFDDDDLIPLATAKFLVLRVLRAIPEAKARRPVSQTEIDTEYARAKKMNPGFVLPQSPRDRHGNMFSFSRQIFKSRDQL